MRLTAGTTFTVKMKSGSLWNVSTSDIKDRAALLVSGIANMLSVERPILMQYYLFRVQMLRAQDPKAFVELLRQAFHELGYENSSLVDIERGETDTNIIREYAAQTLAPAGDVLLKIVWGVAVSVLSGAVLYIWIRRAK